MIVCKQCGHHNEEGDTFCGSCGSFLEWVGEKMAEDEPPAVVAPVAVAEPEGEQRAGILTRLKEKLAGEDDDDVPGVTENPGADRALTAEELAPDPVPVVDAPAERTGDGAGPAAATAATAAAGAGAFAPPSSPGGATTPTPPGGTLATPPAGGFGAPSGAPAPGVDLPPPGGALPAPPGLSPEEAERQAAAARQAAEEQRKAAEEEARKTAEEEQRRKEDEARRRAALLVAKPKAVETTSEAAAATTAAAATPTATPAAGKKGKRGAKDPVPVATTAAAATAAAAATTPIEARSPGAQQPGAAVKPKAKVVKEAPSRAIKPGDLVCGECGEGNDAARKFCRRCGASLVDAPVAKKPGFFKRLFTRKPKEPVAAGTRPGRGGGGGGKGKNAARTGRQAKGKILGIFSSARQMVAILAIFGIGIGFAIPNLRSSAVNFMNTGVTRVRNLISPTYTTVRVEPERTIFTTQAPGAEAAKVSDGFRNTHWSPTPDDPDPRVAVFFPEPTDIDVIFIHSGNQDLPENFASSPRARNLFFRLKDSDGNVSEKQIQLDDSPDAQKFNLKGRDITDIEITLQSCYPDGRICSLAELEFQKKKV